MTKDEFKAQFAEYSSEYLLQLRARGEDGLVDEAHAAIEEILESRGERAPPRPKSAIASPQANDPVGGGQTALNLILVAVCLFVTTFLSQVVKTNQLISWAIGLPIALFFFFRWLRGRSVPPEVLEKEKARDRISAHNFTELMFSAAEGNLERVRDLINYGAVLNAQDEHGGTALMYAAKNGHLAVVQYLLQSGADPALRTKQGNSAASIAKQNGHLDVAQVLGE